MEINCPCKLLCYPSPCYPFNDVEFRHSNKNRENTDSDEGLLNASFQRLRKGEA